MISRRAKAVLDPVDFVSVLPINYPKTAHKKQLFLNTLNTRIILKIEIRQYEILNTTPPET